MEEPAEIAADDVFVPPGSWCGEGDGDHELGAVKRSRLLVHRERPVIEIWTSYVPLDQNVG
jgi:hypothetical protein